MGNVPGTNSCPVADVVTVVPSQAAACDNSSVNNFFNPHELTKKVLQNLKILKFTIWSNMLYLMF